MESAKESSCVFSPIHAVDVLGKEYKEAQSSRDLDDVKRYENIQEVLLTKPPHFLNPFSLDSGGILWSYFVIGFAKYFVITPATYYMIDSLGESGIRYNVFYTLYTFPWSLKFVPGLLSDLVPIFQYRRKSWMLIGWIVYSLYSIAMLWVTSPSYGAVTAAVTVTTMAYIVSDVCTDTLTVERQHYEADRHRGSLQTTGFTFRSFGMMTGALCGALLYNDPTWGWGLTISQIFFLGGLVTVFVFASWWPLLEVVSEVKYPVCTESCTVLWRTMKLWAVIVPAGYCFFYNSLQLPVGAWSNFLIVALGFSNFQVGMITVATTLMMWLGMVIYRQFFFYASFQNVYIYTALLSAFFSTLQILLILRVNTYLGIPDFLFAVGDTALTYLIFYVQYLPISILFQLVLPQGHEGVTYSLLNSIANQGNVVAYCLGTTAEYFWDVSDDAFEDGDYTGILNLTIFTTRSSDSCETMGDLLLRQLPRCSQCSEQLL